MMRKQRLIRKLGMRKLGAGRAWRRREVRVRKGQVGVGRDMIMIVGDDSVVLVVGLGLIWVGRLRG